MHHIYHTEGIILGSRSHGEAGKYFHIFTRDLGLIYATASGVRKMSSKLRFILQDFAYVKVDLVRGKDFWRVTSASKTEGLGDITKRRETLEIFQKISKLLKRLLAGEEGNVELFTDTLNGLSVLEKAQTKEEHSNIEVVLVLRILGNLGYIGESKNLDNLIKSPFDGGIVFEVAKSRPEILREINKALKETHL
ncbi:DNA repair protein RecO [Patescibacteria group bacterium]|nr:DNA repair protein RecO [Patescibacteria group bacterium]